MPRRAKAAQFAVGDKAVFLGYSETPDTPLLNENEVVEIVEAGKDDGGVDVRYIQSAERGEATKEMAYLDELGPHTEPKATRTRTRTATRTRGKPAETAPETQADNGADDSGMVTLQISAEEAEAVKAFVGLCKAISNLTSD